jgi:hypothetical protein
MFVAQERARKHAPGREEALKRLEANSRVATSAAMHQQPQRRYRRRYQGRQLQLAQRDPLNDGAPRHQIAASWSVSFAQHACSSLPPQLPHRMHAGAPLDSNPIQMSCSSSQRAAHGGPAGAHRRPRLLGRGAASRASAARHGQRQPHRHHARPGRAAGPGRPRWHAAPGAGGCGEAGHGAWRGGTRGGAAGGAAQRAVSTAVAPLNCQAHPAPN